MAQYSNWKASQAQKIAEFNEYTEVSFQVFGAAAFNISSDRQSLETSSAIPGGIQLTQQSTSPPYNRPIIGELWVIANAPGSTIEIWWTIKSGGNSLR